ncbi:methylamine utilization protein MauE [Micromonospora sp. PPF5-17]|uniref:Methylamine utilization protein MauE n=1 Tax=Micromonospora solifontis TaxID=2487138 RepID=A0ABX9WIJ5_9ACTN|nr:MULTISPECIES: MauE/DoxX family redox-associated membrane protein [Micromonospora]NES37385.1 methylamine utilization protein MauE [Micromonospora solifontis]NES58070.1 methylamine utilization protein MauE [Micromonospora sp. PPF5-6]RNL98393.1 methylamine utilization protein MauE [Micromonospora solifontis]
MYVEIGCRVLLGTVLLAAAIGKVTGRAAYREFTRSVRDLGYRPAGPLAAAVVAAEFTAVVLLAVFPPVGFGVSAALLLAFTVAIATNLRRGGGTCRCFGRTAAPLGRHHLWRNAFLVGCAVTGALAPSGPVRPDGAVLAVAGALLTGVLVVMLDDLRYLFGATGRT